MLAASPLTAPKPEEATSMVGTLSLSELGRRSSPRPRQRLGRRVPRLAVALVAVAALTGCGSSSSSSLGPPAHPSDGGDTPIRVLAAENEYGSVATQVGGRYVDVSSVESNPNTDPHTYEISPGVAQEVSGAQVLIQNGVGYDGYITKIASASPSSSRQVINVQRLLGLPDSTPNPHLWYSPSTMPKVARALAADLGKLQPSHAAYFNANAGKFIASLAPWRAAIAQFKAKYPATPVATTEPLADYMLAAAGTRNLTPLRFQTGIMNGTDPSPQGMSAQESLLSQRRVKVFVYNQQVTDAVTEGFLTQAEQAGIPVIGVYETMPTPGYTYQSWMLAEMNALDKAVADKISTMKLS